MFQKVLRKNVKLLSPFTAGKANQIIMADNSPDKRVLNIGASTFNETGTSYFHHSIGGYNGAKMKNYQEVVEFYISKEIQQFQIGLQGAKSMNDILPVFNSMPVLNMMNTKYVIYDPNSQPIVNPSAQGGAWFVNNIKWVDSADDEMLALGNTDLKNTAIIRDDQKEKIGEVGDGSGSITLTNYDLDRLVYHSSSTSNQVAVLSEIWYPVGWTATIDGSEVEISRANYLLRTINVPAGEHEIELVFEPSSFYIGEKIALVGSIILILLIGGSIYLKFSNSKENIGE